MSKTTGNKASTILHPRFEKIIYFMVKSKGKPYYGNAAVLFRRRRAQTAVFAMCLEPDVQLSGHM